MDEPEPYRRARELDVRRLYREYAKTHSGTKIYSGARTGENNEDLKPPLSNEETAFGIAVDRYKLENDIRFPNLSELLAILKALGYRKVL